MLSWTTISDLKSSGPEHSHLKSSPDPPNLCQYKDSKSNQASPQTKARSVQTINPQIRKKKARRSDSNRTRERSKITDRIVDLPEARETDWRIKSSRILYEQKQTLLDSIRRGTLRRGGEREKREETEKELADWQRGDSLYKGLIRRGRKRFARGIA